MTGRWRRGKMTADEDWQAWVEARLESGVPLRKLRMFYNRVAPMPWRLRGPFDGDSPISRRTQPLALRRERGNTGVVEKRQNIPLPA